MIVKFFEINDVYQATGFMRGGGRSGGGLLLD
jgi:hypothetical protein